MKSQSKFPFLPFPKSVKIYSEAQLYTPFKKRSRNDKQGEDNTHVDGIVGNFSIHPSTKSGIDLDKDFKYLAVFEAKMYSGLSSGIKNVKNYSQVSRTIAGIINSVLRESQSNPIYYIVTYPNDNKKIKSKSYTKKFIGGDIEERVKLYKEHKTVKKMGGDFENFEKLWKNVLGRIDVQFVTWEDILSEIEDQDIKRFYDLCKKYNK